MANQSIDNGFAQDLKQLSRNRGSIKHKLTILSKYLASIKKDMPAVKPSLSDVEVRYNNGCLLLEEFEKVQSKIESCCEDDDLENQFLEREEFQEKYYQVRNQLFQYINNEKQSDALASQSNFHIPDSLLTSSQQSNSSWDALQNVLLPKLKLPTFSGSFDHWLNFKLNFTSIIDSNVTLTDFQKFQFLKASLQGYATRFVEGYEGASCPYKAAWKNLCSKFDKKQFILDSHFQKLLKLQAINKENYHQFAHMLDEVTKHLTAINGLKLSSDILYDSLILHLLSSKLDKASLREWKELEFNSELPTIDEFIDFVKNKVDVLQSLDQAYDFKANNEIHQTSYRKNQAHNHMRTNLYVQATNTYSIKCNFCKKSHSIYKCQGFLNLSVTQRLENVKRLNLCENCLRTGHNATSCNLGYCRICRSKNKNLKHNSLLHFEQDNPLSVQEPHQSLNMLVKPNVNSHQVILSTIMCKVQDSEGNFHHCRALLDCGAQSNLITKTFVEKLNIPCKASKLSIIGINQVVSQLEESCTLSLHSNYSSFQCSISCFVVPLITNHVPSQNLDVNQLNISTEVQLADPEFHQPKEVDLLIGASLFWNLLVEGKIKLGKNLPTLYNTHFGYIVTGDVLMNCNAFVCSLAQVHIPEDDQLKKFWELEEVKVSSILSKDDLECEKQFQSNTSRDAQGQFVVKFPLKHSPSRLGDSKQSAIKRFLSLEKRFCDLEFKNLYFDFIHEYEQLGHMTKVSDDTSTKSVSDSYFLPHHGVLKEHNITTKLRTVFDGSCPSSTGWSLNDLQFSGPKVQNDIIDIMLRFRTYVYVVSADVSKMFRCILMHPDHRPLQQILWRENPEDEFSIYQLNTVSYGTSSAPYLAIKCMQSLAHEKFDQFPQASETILNDFYVDDLITGSNNLHHLISKCKQIDSILASGHFILRKWVSNHQIAIQDFKSVAISNSTLSFGKNESCKTLGLHWLPDTDNLKYSISKDKVNMPITKRHILSTVAQIYDPLGLVCPIIITAKIIIQRLWSLHVPWDSSIPNELEQSFIKFQSNIVQLNQFLIPRNAVSENYSLTDIHCFSDASQEAYATAVYLRSKNQSTNNYEIHLLCAKSKVAPVKKITIPKLELCACLLGAQLINLVQKALSANVPLFMWSDSQVALSWIKTEPSRLQVFVSHRVSKIQSLTSLDSWGYVNTKENPADVASRGTSANTLFDSSIWWTGPQFLKSPMSEWPSTRHFTPLNDLPEIKRPVKILATSECSYCDIFTKYSSLTKLRRVITLCFRFWKNLINKRNKVNLDTGSLSVCELNNANTKLIKLAQSESFISEIKILSRETTLPKRHKLSMLTPFLDSEGILRVGGRLRNTYLPYDIKHPILISGHHPFTKLIFEYKHSILLHPGPQLLLSSIKQVYWPIGGRSLSKRIVKNCITCFRFKPQSSTYPMASMPDCRIKPSLPFQVTGIDYAGPFLILNKPGRGSKLVKCYLAVFICFNTKAIHIEIVTSLTTECFLACLKRFTSRRGIPHTIYSDNGSTFVGAYNELKLLGQFLQNHQHSIMNATSQDNILWKFIPPYAPNFGGLWESAVKSTKHHLKRVLVNRNVTLEELNTLVIQVEAILNSRPLFSMSDDPNDLLPITPSHFLIGRCLTSIPEPDLQEVTSYRLTRLQHIQKLCQQFWTQFSKHYVSNLHRQYKWKEAPTPIAADTLVLLKNDNLPPCKWSMGRVTQLFPSKDGVARVAEIRTCNGLTTRSVRHLCPLPLQSETDN